MIRQLAWIVPLFASLGATAIAQEEQKDVVVSLPSWVWFTHSDCTPIDPAAPGGTPENPLEVEYFSEAWDNSAFSDNPDILGDAEPNAFECRWIRLNGFMTWLDYYDYRGRLHENGLAAYQPGAANYLIENFAPGSASRGDLARRDITIVGRFHNLCAAAERAERESGESWRVFGPCHYGPHEGMALTDVRIEKVADAGPQYLLGEGNRTLMNSLAVATPEQRKEVDPIVRAWAMSLRKGMTSFIDTYLAAYPKMNAESRRDVRASIESPDSYQSHLLRQPRFLQLDLSTSPLQVFRPVDDDDFDTAIGCVCLAASCGDSWPLTRDDAANFLDSAACVELHRWNKEPWRW